MFHNKKAEVLPIDELKELQLRRLQNIVTYTYENVPHYQQKMLEHDVKPEDIKDLDDICLLPFTTKEDLRKYYPKPFIASKNEDLHLSCTHTTSGSTGIPIIAYFSDSDWKLITLDLMARAYITAGMNSDDIVDLAFPNGLIYAGHVGQDTLQYGVGAQVINIGTGSKLYEAHKLSLVELGVTAFNGTPSTLLVILKKLREENINISKLPLKKAFFIGERLTTNLKNRILELAPKIDIKMGLGQTELGTILSECYVSNGLHLNEDFYVHEIIDSKGNPINKGEGEHVFTTLGREAQPLIRYKSGDITQWLFNYNECLCGRTSRTIEAPIRRVDTFMKIKGTLIDPEKLEKVIFNEKGIIDYSLRISNRDGLDYTKLLLWNDGDVKAKYLNEKIKEAIGIYVDETTFVKNKKELQKGTYKILSVIDGRS